MAGSDQMVPKAVSAPRQRGLLVTLDDFGAGSVADTTHLLSMFAQRADAAQKAGAQNDAERHTA